MFFPIPEIPISVEFMKTYGQPMRCPSKEVRQHIVNTLKSVWDQIPKVDQDIMVDDMAKYKNRRLSFWFVKEWQGRYTTNAFIKPKTDGVIAVDMDYARLANAKHLAASLAHELAHYRDFAGDNDSELTEMTARRFAEQAWSFPRGEVIFKCE